MNVRGVHINRGSVSPGGEREKDRPHFLLLFRSFIWTSASLSQGDISSFLAPVSWCHCGACCTRSIPYGQLGPQEEKGIPHKTQIVSRFQTQHCCLSKKNELKIRAISILEKKANPFTDNRESFFLDIAVLTTVLSFL